MSRIAIILMIFLVVSCGDDIEEQKGMSGNGDVGKIIRFDPKPLQRADKARVVSICQALTKKTASMDMYLGNKYVFNIAQKDCSDSSMGAEEAVDTVLTSDGRYFFRALDPSKQFPFPEVETTSSGSMVEICAKIAKGESPISTGSGANEQGIAFSTISTTGCENDHEHACILIQKGKLNGGRDFKVHTSQLIRFKTLNARQGFFLSKRIWSKADCAEGETMQRSASLVD